MSFRSSVGSGNSKYGLNGSNHSQENDFHYSQQPMSFKFLQIIWEKKGKIKTNGNAFRGLSHSQ